MQEGCGVTNGSLYVSNDNRMKMYKAINASSNVILFTLTISNYKCLIIQNGHSYVHKAILQALQIIEREFREIAKIYSLSCSEYSILFSTLNVDTNDVSFKITDAFKTVNFELEIKIGYEVSVEHELPPMNLIENSYNAIFQEQSSISAKKYSKEINRTLFEQIQKEKELKQALNRNELYVMYQPIISTRSKAVGFEALARWHNPTYGNVSPAEFIRIAEQNESIMGLSTFVIRNALRILRENTTIEFISVNLSAALFNHPDWFVQLLSLLKGEYPEEAKRLRFEITEGIAINKDNLDIVKALRDEGYAVYVDDFGKGYSSFQYLIESVFTGIKVDRDFTKLIGTEKESLLYDLIILANNLQLSVVVEGVETLKQLVYLKNTTVDYLQGFIEAVPLKEEELKHYLKRKLMDSDYCEL